MWRNVRAAALNAMLQLLIIYRFNSLGSKCRYGSQLESQNFKAKAKAKAHIGYLCKEKRHYHFFSNKLKKKKEKKGTWVKENYCE